MNVNTRGSALHCVDGGVRQACRVTYSPVFVPQKSNAIYHNADSVPRGT